MKLKKREKELIKNAVENRISEIEKAIDELDYAEVVGNIYDNLDKEI